MRLRKSSFPNSFCNHFLTKTSRRTESGAFRKAFSFTAYGLKSSAFTGLFFFGSRIRLTMSAIRLAVCSHSKRPRASARAASSRSVRGVGIDSGDSGETEDGDRQLIEGLIDFFVECRILEKFRQRLLASRLEAAARVEDLPNTFRFASGKKSMISSSRAVAASSMASPAMARPNSSSVIPWCPPRACRPQKAHRPEERDQPQDVPAVRRSAFSRSPW